MARRSARRLCIGARITSRPSMIAARSVARKTRSCGDDCSMLLSASPTGRSFARPYWTQVRRSRRQSPIRPDDSRREFSLLRQAEPTGIGLIVTRRETLFEPFRTSPLTAIDVGAIEVPMTTFVQDFHRRRKLCSATQPTNGRVTIIRLIGVRMTDSHARSCESSCSQTHPDPLTAAWHALASSAALISNPLA